MSKNMTNDQNINNYVRRKYLRYGIMIFNLLTMVLAIFSLALELGIGYALVTFFITIILKRMYAKTDIELSKENIEKREKKKKAKEKKHK